MDRENFTEEDKLRKENKMMKFALGGIAGLLLIILAVVLFFVVYNGVKPAESTPTEPSAPVYEYSDYTVSDEDALAAADQVVGRIGDVELTNAELQAYYCMQIYAFIKESGGYVSYYGVDLSKPLGEQIYNTQTGQTWEELFLEQALYVWKRYTALSFMAKENGYQLPADLQQEYEAMPEEMEELAEQFGYASVQEMVSTEMGAGCTFDGYMRYLYTERYCNSYFEKLYSDLMPTLEEMEAYYKEYETTIVNAGASKDVGLAVDVRHILLKPEGGTPIEGTNFSEYTQEAWEACRVKAQKILDEYLASDCSETTFANMAVKYSSCPSASKGGMIANALKGSTVQGFNDWIFDENRQYGDYDLIKTEFGYHIMFFVEREDMWIRYVKTAMISERASTLIDEAMDNAPAEVDLEKIKLSFVHFV